MGAERIDGGSRVRCYTTVPAETMDHWIVAFVDWTDERGLPLTLYASDHPQHPQGVGSTDYAPLPASFGRGMWARRVPFATLPPDVRRCVRDMLGEGR